MEKGQISIHTENIFPIIKKWLYSEKEIFLRELVANATDAILKLEKLSLLGEVKTNTAAPRITIDVDRDRGILTITDTGIGLTADEVRRYINQVAFSSVQEFVEKYQGKADEDQVIGHFGLGFYSAFMVAHKVEIDSLSYQEGAVGTHWSCDGSTEFVLTSSNRKDIGTTISLYIADDSKEMLETSTIHEVLNKYCAFIRYPIQLAGEQVNDPIPLWTKSPSELKDEQYKEFFHKLFPTAADPLFWIHLNVDYPFKLKGILFFPRLQHELDASQGEVKLYSNQVYVADNPKELIPEFLTLLKGAIDCPDLPLNVSRSFLQNDPQVRTIRDHITKKVADKLTGMAKNEKETFEKYWDDIHAFIKYGMLRDHKFYERMVDHLIYRNTKDEFTSLDAYLERMKDKTDGKIIYATDRSMQAGYLSLFRENGIEVLIAETMIDQHFFPYLEMQSSRKYQFQRVDADVLKSLVEPASNLITDNVDPKTITEKVESLFRKYLNKDKLKIRVENLKSSRLPAILVQDENMRRLKEMGRFNQFISTMDNFEVEQTLLVNPNSSAVKNLLALAGGLAPQEDKLRLMVQHIYDLAYMQNGKFTPDTMQQFVERASDLLGGYGGSVTQ